MDAFPDIPEAESRRVARCLRVVEAIQRGAQDQVTKQVESAEKGGLPSYSTRAKGTRGAMGTKGTSDTKVPCGYPGESPRDPLEVIPNPEQAKFVALGAQLMIIRDLCKQDLRFKTFYDLTGSGGNAGLTAVFLQQWSKVVSLECTKPKQDTAVISRRLAQRVDSPDMLTRLAAWRIESGTFKQTDWIDGDVVFLDATILDSLDEGVFCRYIQGRLRAVQAGSFVVLFTRCTDQLITKDSLHLISRQMIRHTGDRGKGGKFTSWLFKTTMHSTDYRVGVCDWSESKREASGPTIHSKN